MIKNVTRNEHCEEKISIFAEFKKLKIELKKSSIKVMKFYYLKILNKYNQWKKHQVSEIRNKQLTLFIF